MGIDTKQTSRSRVRAFGRTNGPRAAGLAWLMLAGGVLSLAAAAASRMSPLPHPALARIDKVLGRLGLDTGTLVLAGLGLLAAGLVLRSIGGFARLLGQDRATALAVDELVETSSGQRETVTEIEESVRVLHTELARTQHALEQLTQRQAESTTEESILRLAASLDQLWARVDGSVLDARDLVIHEVRTAANALRQVDDGGLRLVGERMEHGFIHMSRSVEAMRGELAAALETPPRAPEVDPEVDPAHPGWEAPHDAGLHAPHGAEAREGAEAHGVDLADDAGHGALQDPGHDHAPAWGTADLETDEDGHSDDGGVAWSEEGCGASSFLTGADEHDGATTASQHEGPTFDEPETEPWTSELEGSEGEKPDDAPAPGPVLRLLEDDAAAAAPESKEHDHEAWAQDAAGDPDATDADEDAEGTEGTSTHQIQVDLDATFVDLTEEAVPAPLPNERPQGLDLLERLDSSHTLEIEARDDVPPLFPDL